MSNETKWTPGPWSIRTTGPHWNNQELCNIEINYGDDTECICDTVYEMADAHLIAAAPELYEMLDQAVTSMLDSGYSKDSVAIRACIEALAKARGES